MSKARNLANLLSDGAVGADELAPGASLPSQSGQSGKYLTTDGTTASWAVVPLPDEIRDPVNSSPANGSGGQLETTTLTSSAFRSLYGETHSKSQWQVSTASDFSTTVVSTGDSDSLTSYTISSGVLSTSTTYYWRVRYKDSNGTYSDWSTATTFITASSFAYSIEYLVVAGGGGGGYSGGGGGGAGGYRTGSSVLNGASSYSIVVGLGGSGATSGSVKGTNGSVSTFNSITSTGGGGGGSYSGSMAGASGGSGGGAAADGSASHSGGSGTSGQGNNGGGSVAVSPFPAGGGGGALDPGVTGSGSQAGNGGSGANWLSLGTFYAGGGGGGGTSQGASAGGGGSGGGGNGGNYGAAGSAGTTNRGGGGGGGGNGNAGATSYGGAGGSGIVIIRYSGSQRGTGGAVTSANGYTIHTFTSSGTFTA